MKYIFTFFTSFLVALLMCRSEAHAQSGWFSQSGGTNDLFGVFFTDANTGTTVGLNGTIRRTTDGGALWTSQTSGTTNILYGVSFADANTGTAVGDLGTIRRTTDGGALWTSQTSGTTNSLYGVSFTDANTGTAVGDLGTILHTTNGGASWTSQTSGTTNILYGVSFTDASTGTAVGSSGRILRTTNGGALWTSQTSGTTRLLTSVSFTDANTGTVVGELGTILRTTTGGVVWVREDRAGVPQRFLLEQNYPNPFNPSTTIQFSLPRGAHVSLKVFNTLGEEITTLVSEELGAGTYTTQWNAAGIASGVYYYRLQAGNYIESKKLMLLK